MAKTRNYLVRWEVEVDAATPKAAAKLALEMQRDPVSTATCFEVFNPRGQMTEVDLEQEEEK